MIQIAAILSLLLGALCAAAAERAPAGLVRSAQSGCWSAPATWEGNKVPRAGDRVQIQANHRVLYDVASDQPIRMIHVAGRLSFARAKDTLLNVGLIKVQPGDDAREEGFDCDAHVPQVDSSRSQPALEVGTPDQPIDAHHRAIIRLVYIDGMDKESCPAIVCCGGRMDFHGAPLNRTWVKLGAGAKAGSTEVTLAEPVTGWQAGDRVILTATTRQNKIKKTFRKSVRDDPATEERITGGLEGTRLTLDRPLSKDHRGEGVYRGEVANLSRNVIVESANPAGPRGHTMYHRNSAGSISYAEFRHLGKEGVLGRYSLHFHLVGDTMRGSSVIGASIWDSGNRWLTIHGTNYLVVRDCVGYRSMGHGFFFEDGTEVNNILDRNLAVQAFAAQPLPRQFVPFDKNDGSGFWWANSHNSFTRNVACECDEYGYFFQAAKTDDFDPVLRVLHPDGQRRPTDIRTLPFIRFDDNESHTQRRHAFNLGGGVPFGKPNVDGVGPDERHPFVIRNLKAWDVHWAIHPVSPSVLLDGVDIYNAEYGIWRPVYERHAYHKVHFSEVPADTRYAFGLKPPNAEDAYPRPLTPVDDLPPVTVITHVNQESGKVVVRGVATDNGTIRRVLVNGQEAHALAPNFTEWQVILNKPVAGEGQLIAHAEDAAGNVEKLAHAVRGIAKIESK